MGLDDMLEWFKDTGESIIEFFANIGDWFANLFGFMEDISGGGDTPLSHWAFWVLVILYLMGLWYLPQKIGLSTLALGDKILSTVVVIPVMYYIFWRLQTN